MDRRRFVGTVGGALAAWPLGAACGAEPEPQPDRPPGLAAAPGATPDAAQGRPIGVQLYTVRRQLAEDFEGTLARVAEIGYREVEFAGYAGRTPRDVRRVLDAAGLVAPSAHVDFPAMAANWESTLAGAREIGHHYLTIPSIPRQDRTAEGYRRVAEQFNRFGERAAAAGLEFAYHNHDFEFVAVEGGSLGYDLLLRETDPRLVKLELDLFWVTRGGGDPLAYFAQWPGRFPMVHAKDMDGTPERGMTEVGSGIIPFPAIAARAEQAGIRHWFVEHDNPSAPLESIRRSFEGLRRVVPA
jgi:sugar phosphate isomerase/epimerase